MKSILMAAVFLLPILSASKSPCPYSRYQIESWVIGGSEGFRDTWYPDGVTRAGKQKYSIGHGYNDWGVAKRRWKISKALEGGLTWEESMDISRGELESYKTGHTDLYVDLAFRLHYYNVGGCKSIQDLGKCCGGTKGCGSPDRNVRLSHNPRRRLELALGTHNFEVANEMIEYFRSKKEAVWMQYKTKTKNQKPNEKPKTKNSVEAKRVAGVATVPADPPSQFWSILWDVLH